MITFIENYVFDHVARTITFSDFTAIELGRVALITDVTTNTILFNFADPSIATATVSGNVVTLSTIPANAANTDKLRIDYTGAAGDPTHDAAITVNTSNDEFRDGFASPFVGGVPDPKIWKLSNTDNHTITQGGNSSGSAYLCISLNPLLEDTEVTLTSVKTYQVPVRIGFGVSISQRIIGQEVYAGLNGDDGAGNVQLMSAGSQIADQAITGATISIISNVGTVTLNNHPYKGGDRVSLYGCPDSRMNVGPVIVTPTGVNTFTVPITAANGTYNCSGGFVRYADPLRSAYNGAGYLWENATPTNASLVARRNGQRFRSLISTVTTTTATQSNTSAFTDAFNSGGNFEAELRLEEVDFRSYASDGVANANIAKYTQGIPDDTPPYHISLRARTLKGSSKPVARITAIAKTGTTTATVTTDVAHGLTTSDFVQIYGVQDQTNFPNLTASTAVASVIDAFNFTIIIGTATTTSSSGGAVWRNQGSVLAPGVFTQVVQSISSTGGVMTVIGSGTWATPLPGEHVYLYGMQNGAGIYDGMYQVLQVSTTSLVLSAPNVVDFVSINTGGAAIRVTDVRLHFTRLIDYERMVAEIVGGRGGVSDQNNSVPVYSTGGTYAVTQSSGSAGLPWNAAGYGGLMVADVASAAITATTTTSSITPGALANIGVYAHSFNVIVTAATGTNETLDVGVEESMDNGTNWVRVYDFPRITAVGAYTSPLVRAHLGTRYRYVQTVAGSSPSFTRAINRVEFSSAPPLYRQFIDRTINFNLLNSTTASWQVAASDTLQMFVSCGAITTTAPQFQLQGSEDKGTTWYNIGSPVTAVASSTVAGPIQQGVMADMVRVLETTAGVGATIGANGIQVKAYGR